MSAQRKLGSVGYGEWWKREFRLPPKGRMAGEKTLIKTPRACFEVAYKGRWPPKTSDKGKLAHLCPDPCPFKKEFYTLSSF